MMPFSVRVSKPGLLEKKSRNRSLILPLFSLGEIFGSSNVTPLSKLLAVKRQALLFISAVKRYQPMFQTNNLCHIPYLFPS